MTQSLIEQGRFFFEGHSPQAMISPPPIRSRGIAPPPIEKPFAEESKRIDLPPQEGGRETIRGIDLRTAIRNRRSRRTYRNESLTVEELSFLLWATQGISRRIDEGHAFRTVPSAGCRHAIETYLCVLNVAGVDQGLYRYLPLEHQLLLESGDDRLAERIVKAAFGQGSPGKAAVTFIWTAVPYRMEWRYGGAAHKVIALDAGHVCQNLYLACEAIGAGTCAMAAYDQEEMDRLVGVDGTDEFVIYLAPVGKIVQSI